MSDLLDLPYLADGIGSIDGRFSFDGNLLRYDDEPYGEIEITYSGDAAFAAYTNEIRQIAAAIFDCYGYQHPRSMSALDDATEIVILHAIWPPDLPRQNRMFERFDPIWDWLLAERGGIVNVDYGDFHNADGTIH